MIRLHIASLASLIFANDPIIDTFWSAMTILVLVAFSMANFVFPSERKREAGGNFSSIQSILVKKC